jgi:hypothetical protein
LHEPTTAENYLRDLGHLIGEMALDARAEYTAIKGSTGDGYKLGRLMAFHEVVSLMKDQAEIFGIPQSAISLGEIDPERDLI